MKRKLRIKRKFRKLFPLSDILHREYIIANRTFDQASFANRCFEYYGEHTCKKCKSFAREDNTSICGMFSDENGRLEVEEDFTCAAWKKDIK